MKDFILTNGRTLEGTTVDIEIRDGIIDAVIPGGDGGPSRFDADQHYDAGGRLVTPPLIEPHTHLDSALIGGDPYWNRSNTLEEGWRRWTEVREELTKPEIKQRARRVIEWFVSFGITRIRTHVNSSHPDLTTVKALVELRDELTAVDLQLVSFPMDSLAGNEAGQQIFESTLEMGVDLVGGVPHKEPTRERAIEHIDAIVDMATAYDCGLDVHIDETDDPQSRCTEVLATQVDERGIGERTTASHVTALHSYPNAYADKLIRLIADSGMSVITNPITNSVLQGRYDDYPRRRGHTRIEELRAAGVPVGIGQDNIVDLFNPYGNGDPLKGAFLLAHFAHINGYEDARTIWELLTTENAEVYGVDSYGLEEGNEGSFVVYNQQEPFDVLRTQGPRSLVVSKGNILAQSTLNATVSLDGAPKAVDYSRSFNN